MLEIDKRKKRRRMRVSLRKRKASKRRDEVKEVRGGLHTAV